MEEILQVMEFIFKGKKATALKFEKTPEKSGKQYDLSSLKQFIGEDKEALKNIIALFVESTQTNSEELQKNIKNLDKLSKTAHRMLPMFRQIESFELAFLLEKLEYKKVPKKETEKYISDLIEKINILIFELKSNYKL